MLEIAVTNIFYICNFFFSKAFILNKVDTACGYFGNSLNTLSSLNKYLVIWIISERTRQTNKKRERRRERRWERERERERDRQDSYPNKMKYLYAMNIPIIQQEFITACFYLIQSTLARYRTDRTFYYTILGLFLPISLIRCAYLITKIVAILRQFNPLTL